MLGLPKSTEFNKRIPKQKFYENLTVSPALKRVFVEQIRVIYWRNKIAPSTVNIAAGEKVTELEVFEIQLNQPSLDEKVLQQIDKEIPYHILFVLSYEDKVQAWIGFKEAANTGNNAFKVNRYYHTDWIAEEQLSLQLTGLNMDSVYEGYVRQIAQDLADTSTESLRDSVQKAEQKAALEKKIAILQARIRKEKQLNVQMRLNTEVKKLKKELEESMV
jgi:hypothetical protein